VKRPILCCSFALSLALVSPAFAQRSHPGGGPPAGHSPGSGSGMNSPHDASSTAHSDMHGSPTDVLSHNTAIAGKIKTLTGQDAQTACSGFKNMGQCVAAAHVAKNLNIPGGFDALKAKITGTGSVSLGKAIQALAPDADAKAEAKEANKQAEDDLQQTAST